jgi:glycosyltransferase involved in cell wall biosynthesis
MKRILHFIGSLETGGTENMLLAYLKNTKNEDLEHIVCTVYDRGAMKEKFETAGVRVVSLNLSSKLLLPLALFKFSDILNRLHPDVVHSYLLQENVIARIVCKLTKRKLICGKRDTDRYKMFLKVWLDRLTLSMTGLNISNSMAGVEELRSYGVPENKVTFVANGKDVYSLEKTLKKMDAKKKLGFAPQEIILGCVARLYRFKGHEYLLKAMQKIAQETPNAKLVLVGDGNMKERLLKLKNELGLDNSVFFMGERKDVPELLAAMDLFVFPSLREGMPGALMEAMAAGLPVVATDIDGNRELIENGKNGILVPPGDSEAFAEAVNTLLSDPGKMHGLAMSARNTIKEKFSIGLMVKKLDKIYLDF